MNLHFKCSHTPGAPTLLESLGCSLIVSTYQSDKLVLLRTTNGQLNAHLKAIDTPMGIAASANKLAVGHKGAISEFVSAPAACEKLAQQGVAVDAVYVPNITQHTGDIDVHEMAWVDETLFFINTRFSAVCKFERGTSFIPVWRPPFITAYDIRDRCHLNGLAIREGKIRYVSMLAASDEPLGWRSEKQAGGLLMDINDNRVIACNLSMPHSPRWHDERLWFLESGKGTLAFVDPKKGEIRVVAVLPGFTRGLTFVGRTAFVGVSRARDTATFAGTQITKADSPRECGIWAINIDSGETLATFKFDEGVDEIFSITTLPHRFPEVFTTPNNLTQTTYIVDDATAKNTQKLDEQWQTAAQHLVRGNNLYQQGQLRQALDSYELALSIDPCHLLARFNRAVTLVDLGAKSQAINDLKRVISDDASFADGWALLGILLDEAGDPNADHILTRAMALNPNNSAVKKCLEKFDGPLGESF